jgi:hypothetical protein
MKALKDAPLVKDATGLVSSLAGKGGSLFDRVESFFTTQFDKLVHAIKEQKESMMETQRTPKMRNQNGVMAKVEEIDRLAGASAGGSSGVPSVNQFNQKTNINNTTRVVVPHVKIRRKQ